MIRIRITKVEHPHEGDEGTLTGQTKFFKHIGDMKEVILDSCEHGIKARQEDGKYVIYVLDGVYTKI